MNAFQSTVNSLLVFNTKNSHEVIVRFPKDRQTNAIKNKGIKPFSHGAKAGWVEINVKSVEIDDMFNWVKKGYEYALTLSRKSKK